ncbi:TPA: hypothetical protein N0F65_000145 [Lagenidium giganteum]|uniref:3-oxo-5-alpha-steroid 4-dehydrogenase C-terminal domain-containing protein n=1 Tax=Lagenidium giganteum TaxID=4803 RepID=A0AAV2YKD4_9STRA|nr:TPA: hypothetical protein N0F65_000145 [Lagenidium giganteum]
MTTTVLVLRCLWVAFSACVLSTLISGFFKSMIVHGKQREASTLSKLPHFWVLQIELKKRWWTFFYFGGTVFNGMLVYAVWMQPRSATMQSLLALVHEVPKDSSASYLQINDNTRFFTILFQVQVTRRFLESLLVTEFGSSTMHASDPDAIITYEDTWCRSRVIGLGALLFLVGSQHQFQCNRILASMKRQNGMKHVLARGDWFDFVRCPLYTTEVLIYLGFALICGGSNVTMYFVFVWVIVNQAVCADLQSKWYDTKFRERLHELPRWKLLPRMKKSAWTWFYTAGCFWNVFLFYLVYFQPESAMTQSMLRWLQASDDASTPLVVRNEVVVFMACFAVQSTRRFLECLFVTQFGKARMHVSVLIIGFTHYLLIGVSVLSDKDALNDKEPDNVRASATRLGLALFALGSYHQFMCNHLLAKQKAANKMRHVLPRGDWFELTRSPLYTTEILIYLAFLFITGGTTISLYFVFIWVFANQAICAHNNYNWYEDKFRDRLAELPKYKLIPYIW